jgi:hypothetical protein
MSLESAKFKLREANYFLRKLVEATKATPKEDEIIRFLLSALLSAADAVAERGDTDDPSFYSFRLTWKQGLNDDDRRIYEFMQTQRDAEVHKTGATIDATQRVDPARKRARDQFGRTPIAAIVADAQARGVEIDLNDVYPGRVREEWIFRGLTPGTEPNVIKFATRYLELLTDVISQHDALVRPSAGRS